MDDKWSDDIVSLDMQESIWNQAGSSGSRTALPTHFQRILVASAEDVR
ncbi:MAG: hypothetical protein BMS9Abin02_1512 [Anaerolineae bacterium]|nr:MAG: hypothetical protein BMS9Abin02_1512 [Anaerolineae bacterium]